RHLVRSRQHLLSRLQRAGHRLRAGLGDRERARAQHSDLRQRSLALRADGHRDRRRRRLAGRLCVDRYGRLVAEELAPACRPLGNRAGDRVRRGAADRGAHRRLLVGVVGARAAQVERRRRQLAARARLPELRGPCAEACVSLGNANVVLRPRSTLESLDLTLLFLTRLGGRQYLLLSALVLLPALGVCLALQLVFELAWADVWLLAVPLGLWLQGVFTLAAG